MSTSPISNLNDDTLLSIIDIITSRIPTGYSPRMDRPLVVVQIASHVCRRWRVLLLGSPWIWGRIIDLNLFLGPRAVEGLEEISRRAGSAPLWIYGNVSMHVDGVWHFIKLLDSWERIEKLVVVIHATNDDGIPDSIKTRFLSPAPVLQLFDVQLFCTKGYTLYLETLKPGSSRSLFANHAPSLRIMRTAQVAYKLDSPWLSNIREITVPNNLDLNDIFLLLQQTPLIETIRIDSEDLVWRTTHPPLHKLNLPRLSSMTIFTNLPAVARMLDFITPGSLSRLYMNINDSQTAEIHDPSILSSLRKNLACYITNYLTANPSKVILLDMMTYSFRFCDVTSSISDGNMADFEITTRSYVFQNWDSIIFCLLDALMLSLDGNPSIVESVTHMRVPRLEIQSCMLPRLYSFLCSFRHIRDIQTREEYGHTLFALANIDEADGDAEYVLFPELHTLRLSSTEVHCTGRNIQCNDITEYLTRRKILGFPLAKLDLTSCTKLYYAQDLSILEELNGLEVIWRERKDGDFESAKGSEICRYICGTGRPERLRGVVGL